MTKIVFIGAGSTVFVKNIIGDCLLSPSLSHSEIALYDIDEKRLNESKLLIDSLNKSVNNSQAVIKTYLGLKNRKEAFKNADFMINAIQVGGYKPSTVIDFEIPKKYGIRQTIADTLGIGGIFRGLRTINVLEGIADDILEVAPNALFLNYSNPMAILTGYLQRRGIRVIGLCHSVQVAAQSIVGDVCGLDWESMKDEVVWDVRGINHMAWLLKLEHKGEDLYPKIKELASQKLQKALRGDIEKTYWNDMVRISMMLEFGYYITESSEHNAEYTPYWIKSNFPDLVDKYQIPLDEYPRRCEEQIEGWEKLKQTIMGSDNIEHKRSHEYGSYIIEAVVSNKATKIYGNVLNTNGLIPNLPEEATVELPCLVDGNGVQPLAQKALPIQCAALNTTNINPQILTIDAAIAKNKQRVYQAAFLDPHTSAELDLKSIKSMCDELIEAHGDYLPKYN